MPLINFQDAKKKINFQLDIPANSTFLAISELVFKHFNLDKNDFHQNNTTKLKFIYKSIICTYDRTPESYQIEPQSTITVYFPKIINEIISKSSIKTPTVSENSSTTAPNNSSTANINQTNEKKEPEEIISQINNLNQQTAQVSTTDHSKVINYVDQRILKTLVDFGFDEINAAYALAYKKQINSTIDFLNLGIVSDPIVKNHIYQIVSASLQSNNNEVIHHTLELAKLEARAKNENEKIAVAAAIGVFAYKSEIDDQEYIKELKEYVKQVEIEYPGQTIEKVKQLLDDENPDQIHDFSTHENEFNSNVQLSQMSQFNQPSQLYYPNQMNFMNQSAFPNQMNQPIFLNQMSQSTFPNQMNQMNNYNMMNQMNQFNQTSQLNHQNNINNFNQMSQSTFPNQFNNYNMMNQMNNFGFPNQMNQQQQQVVIIPQQANPIHEFSNIRLKFWSNFEQIPNMSDQNYMNPFLETYNDLSKIYSVPKDDPFFDYGKTLNFEQLKFVYKTHKEKKVEVSIILQYLNIVDGDIQKAEELINAQ